jgi:tetratricopeptide (TPR) repeat protein
LSNIALMLRAFGLIFCSAYAALIVWLYAAQPQNVAEMAGGLAAEIGVYEIDQQAFEDGLKFFRQDKFEEARATLTRADPAQRDARTQFYIAYSYYRQGWGRLYNDDQLFRKGLQAVDKAISLAPDQRMVVDDTNLGMKSADELRAELQRGLTRDVSDLNPLRVLETRK